MFQSAFRTVSLFLALFFSLTKGNSMAPDSLPPVDSLSNEMVMKLANDFFARSTFFENKFIQSAQQATYTLQVKEAELANRQQDSTATKQDISRQKLLVKNLKKLESVAVSHKKEAIAITDFAFKTTEMDTAAVRKRLTKLADKVARLEKTDLENQKVLVSIEEKISESLASPIEPKPLPKPESKVEDAAPEKMEETAQAIDSQAVEADSARLKPEKAVKKKKEKPAPEPGAKFKKYAAKDDVMLSPPQAPCNFSFNGRDEFSGEIRREIEPEEFFRFTAEMMKNALKDQPHILCMANVSVSGSLTTLNLVFTINDQNARRAFGGFSKGSTAVLKLVDGSVFNLPNLRSDEGAADPSGRTCVFRGQFGLDKNLLRKIGSIEVDKIRVSWNKGYEDYEIYNVDLLKRQIGCLESQ